ncbi:polysaccharide deacetylase family protein, partial [Streptomyces sp. NPDC057242]
MPSGRRTVLRLAAALGATATVGVFAADRLAAPDRATGAAPRHAPGPGTAQGAAGPAAGPGAETARLNPNAYRLRPMTAYAPPTYRRGLAPPGRRRGHSEGGAPPGTVGLEEKPPHP